MDWNTVQKRIITTIEWVPVVCECHLYFIRVYIINGEGFQTKKISFRADNRFDTPSGPPPAKYEWIAIYIYIYECGGYIDWMDGVSKRTICMYTIHSWNNVRESNCPYVWARVPFHVSLVTVRWQSGKQKVWIHQRIYVSHVFYIFALCFLQRSVAYCATRRQTNTRIFI